MAQRINQLNVSITTNRTCTLKCTHCYIEPELFKDKSQMSRETFIAIFDKVKELVLLDQKLQVVEWEAIGGETTMMPFEWWEEMLPVALEQIAEVNKLTKAKGGREGGLNFLSNLIYRDKRYTELFKKYKDHPLFFLYTSWEPDTNRFGNKDKMYPKFISTLENIGSKRVILDLILTKTLLTINPKDILDTFTQLGVNDFSIKMLSPFGSGKEFFKNNMTDFHKMASWVQELKTLSKGVMVGDREVRMTPVNELEGSLWEGSAFQCNGGFKYDLSIEPNGETHFNANQTGDDKAVGFKPIHINDANWATRVLFENKTEESRKFHTTDSRCYTCEYMRYCCGGWYHYRSAPFDQVAKYAKEDCQGMKLLWDKAKEDLGDVFNHSQHNYSSLMIEALNEGDPLSENFNYICEAGLLDDYTEYLKTLESSDHQILVDLDTYDNLYFGKDTYERISAYCDAGIKVLLKKIPNGFAGEQIIYHYITGNLNNLNISYSTVVEYLRKPSTSPKVNLLTQIHDRLILSFSEFTPRIGKTSLINHLPLLDIGELDERYDEALRFFIAELVDVDHPPETSDMYLNLLIQQHLTLQQLKN